MADTRLLVGLCLSLLISSLCISLIVDTDAASLGDTVLYKPVDVDFSNPSETEANTTKIYEVVTGGWKGSSSGLVSTQPGENVVYLMVLDGGEGRYENVYRIGNPDGRPYKIVVRDTSLWSDSLRLKIESSRVTLESKNLFGSYAYRASKPVSVGSFGNDYTVKTVLNEVEKTVDVWINNQYVARFVDIPEDSFWSFGPSTYSGIIVDGAGFVFKGFVSSGERLGGESFDLWGFIGSLAGVLGWYTSSGVPLVDAFINLIIKIQQLGI
ncbi:MAG: hypothetical protein ACOYIP_08740, partial [Coriobacteriales bacterium]